MEKQLRKGGKLSIKRSTAPAEQPVSEQAIIQSTTQPTGSINLASAPTETDPFRKSVTDAGYNILEENEYGVIARMDKGKPSFIPKTNHGFDPNEKQCRNTIVIAEHIDTALKVHAAKTRVNVTQYLTQLLVADLRKEGYL